MGTLQNDAQSFYKTQKSIIDFLFTKKIINYASVLHSVGQSEIKSYLQYGGKEEKIIQIENGINLEELKSKKSTNILKKFKIVNEPYILFLGRIHPKKGIELLIDSFKELSYKNNKIYLVIAGSGENDYVKKIKKDVTESYLMNKIKFTGLVTQDEKLDLLKSAKLFSLISKSDVHPRAVQEALAIGVPVVISKESDYPEVKEYNAGMIVNLNVKEVAHAFEKLLQNNDELKILSANAKKLINEKFLAEDQILKFEKTYSNMLFRK
jgi:glycosyltransferase involved in cell wall biosynthesis